MEAQLYSFFNGKIDLLYLFSTPLFANKKLMM